jgi:hypothetical protein
LDGRAGGCNGATIGGNRGQTAVSVPRWKTLLGASGNWKLPAVGLEFPSNEVFGKVTTIRGGGGSECSWSLKLPLHRRARTVYTAQHFFWSHVVGTHSGRGNLCTVGRGERDC